MTLLKNLITNGLLTRDESAKGLAVPYLEKAKINLTTMELLSKATSFKDILELPQDYRADEWVIVAAYYSMYLAALSVLAQLGYRCKSHAAAIVALEEFLVKKALLDKKYLYLLEKVSINNKNSPLVPISALKCGVLRHSLKWRVFELWSALKCGVLNPALHNKYEIETLKDAKDKHEIAQYSVTKKLSLVLAEEIKIDARHFVDKMEEVLNV